MYCNERPDLQLFPALQDYLHLGKNMRRDYWLSFANSSSDRQCGWTPSDWAYVQGFSDEQQEKLNRFTIWKRTREVKHQEYQRQINSQNRQTPWRYADAHDKITAIEAGLVLGKKLRHMIGHEQWEDLVSFINSRLPSNFWGKLSDEVCTKLEDAEFRLCDECGTMQAAGNFNFSSWHGIAFCGQCCDQRWSYSEVMDDYIHAEEAQTYYPTQRAYDRDERDVLVADWVRQQDDIRWSDYADAWVHGNVEIAEDYDDEDDEDEDRPVGSWVADGLADYHDASRNFRTFNRNDKKPFLKAPAIGLELELYAPNRKHTVGMLRYEFSQSKSCFGTLRLERDGSLCERHGMEIITDPLGYTEWQIMGKPLCEALQNDGCIAYKAEGNYGIHLTVHRDHFTPLQEARMLLFMSSVQNRNFMMAVAQRRGIYAPDLEMGSMTIAQQKIRQIGGLGPQNGSSKKIYGRGKYAPINVKQDLLEIRVFRATLHPESFMKNIEFVYSMIEWLRSPSGSSWEYLDYVAWLGKRPQAFADYPKLMTYLRRPEYGVRYENVRVLNTWSDLLPKSREELGYLDCSELRA